MRASIFYNFDVAGFIGLLLVPPDHPHLLHPARLHRNVCDGALERLLVYIGLFFLTPAVSQLNALSKAGPSCGLRHYRRDLWGFFSVQWK